jgi:hypothetical protein
MELWNYGAITNTDILRTNNAIEGWHSIFKRGFGSSRYSYDILVYMLKDEENIQQKYFQLIAGFNTEGN